MLHPEEVSRIAPRIQAIAQAMLDDLDRAAREPALTADDFGNLNVDKQAYQLHAQIVGDSSTTARERGVHLDESAGTLAKYATAQQNNNVAHAARLDALRHGR